MTPKPSVSGICTSRNTRSGRRGVGDFQRGRGAVEQSKAIALAAPTSARLLVFSVSPPSAGDEVAKLFKDLQAAFPPAAKK
jgi:hypothetical protein